MRTRREASITELRQAIDCLPRTTREAMLRGINTNEIIVGAYSDGDGICPMLAAHRNGGRTDFIGFARAWDRVAFRGSRVRVARRATEREMLILRTHLEASLMADDAGELDLGAALAEHQQLVSRRERTAAARRERIVRREQAARRERADRHEPAATSGSGRVRPGDPDRSRELAPRHGWAWMRVFRRYDDYERALARLEQEQRALAEREPELV